MATPDAEVVTLLDGTNGLTSGTNLFHGPLRPRIDNGSPAEAVFVLGSGGPVRIGYLDGDTYSSEIAKLDVQITVRSDTQDFEGGQTLARGVYSTVHNGTIAGYYYVRAQQASPIYLGLNEHGFHLWTVNVQMWLEE